MELVKGGSLQEIFEERKGKQDPPFTTKEAASIMKSLLEAVNYIHQKNIVHRDLKLDNLLVKNKENLESIKLGDFGLSTKIDRGTEGTNSLFKNCGTFLYMSPEILRNRPYSKPVDIWSSGIIMYTLLSGLHPLFIAKDTRETLQTKILSPVWEFDSQVFNAKAKDLFLKLVQMEPSKRYTASQAVRHPWITQESKCPVPLTITEFCRLSPTKNHISKGIKLLLLIEFLRNFQTNSNESRESLFKKESGHGTLDYVLEKELRNAFEKRLADVAEVIYNNYKVKTGKRFSSNNSRFQYQVAQTFTNSIHRSFENNPLDDKETFGRGQTPEKELEKMQESYRSSGKSDCSTKRNNFGPDNFFIRQALVFSPKTEGKTDRSLNREGSGDSFQNQKLKIIGGGKPGLSNQKSGLSNKPPLPKRKSTNSELSTGFNPNSPGFNKSQLTPEGLRKSQMDVKFAGSNALQETKVKRFFEDSENESNEGSSARNLGETRNKSKTSSHCNGNREFARRSFHLINVEKPNKTLISSVSPQKYEENKKKEVPRRQIRPSPPESVKNTQTSIKIVFFWK
jgi:serine/threonine protein kinase